MLNNLNEKFVVDLDTLHLLKKALLNAKPDQALERLNAILLQNNAGWVAVPLDASDEQRKGNVNYSISQQRWKAILEKSPPLPAERST